MYDKPITDLQALSKTGKLVYASADDVFPTWDSLMVAGYMDRGARELDYAIENVDQTEVASRCKIAVERDLERLLFPKARVGVQKGWMPVISAMTDPPTRVLQQYKAVYNRNNSASSQLMTERLNERGTLASFLFSPEHPITSDLIDFAYRRGPYVTPPRHRRSGPT